MPAEPRPTLEVADIFRGEAESFLRRSGKHLSFAQKRAFAAISACRTAALGGHVVACNHCDHQRISYNSCRNRHCPKCQALARPAAASNIAERSIASSATIDAAVNAADESCAVFANFQHR